ncbi:MAG: hypothetical protein SGILL_008161 [Bacillariaceae sp.]
MAGASRYLRGATTAPNATVIFEDPAPPETASFLAPIFFQCSLIPYLLFLYFLGFRDNGVPGLANFGFQFLLLFVVATAVAGAVARALFDSSLANVDWIHGSAESLLTISNILIVIGFQNAISGQNVSMRTGVLISFVATLLLGAFVIYGVSTGFEEHDQFLWGIGNVNQELPWTVRTEPENALSIATWTIHFMSVVEYIVAMNLVWKFADATSNPRWKGLTWGMLPNHASSICAVTHHFFHNNNDLLFLVTAQAFFTMLGSTTTMVAAFRLAKSNGWTFRSQEGTSEPSDRHLRRLQEPTNNIVLLTKVLCFTVMLSCIVKYGELAVYFPGTPNVAVAVTIVTGIPLVVALFYLRLSFAEYSGSSEEAQRLTNSSEHLKNNGTFS